MDHFGHVECGVFATVVSPGVVMPGDAVRVVS
jgi:MOSC domain-containing protein YiiM